MIQGRVKDSTDKETPRELFLSKSVGCDKRFTAKSTSIVNYHIMLQAPLIWTPRPVFPLLYRLDGKKSKKHETSFSRDSILEPRNLVQVLIFVQGEKRDMTHHQQDERLYTHGLSVKNYQY